MNTPIINYGDDPVKGFLVLDSLNQLPYEQKILRYARDSTRSQERQLHMQASNLDNQVGNPQRLWRPGIVEIHTGTTLDRPGLREAIRIARKHGLIILAESIDRLVRHIDYCPKKGRLYHPTPEQIAELLSHGVYFMLFTTGRSRSVETKRGLPKRDEGLLKEMRTLRALDISYGNIARLTKTPKATVIRWLQSTN